MQVRNEQNLDAGTRRFLAQPKRMLIGGEWVEANAGGQLDVIDPATAEVFSRVPEGDERSSLRQTSSNSAPGTRVISPEASHLRRRPLSVRKDQTRSIGPGRRRSMQSVSGAVSLP